MNIHSDLTSLIGHTPLVALHRVENAYNLQAHLVAKVESFNPGGSVKDRVALSMILDAEQRGLLQPGATIIEPTSGNTGVGLAWISAIRGYQMILVMPDTMSVERRAIVQAYGAQVVLTPGKEGMAGAIAKANELHHSIPGSFIPGQFDNPANPQAHLLTTAEEIWSDTDGQVDLFVAGVGTGGTVSGVAEGLKRHNPHVHVVAVEPATSAVLFGQPAGPHPLQGIGAGFVPANYHADYVDEVLTVSGEEAFAAARMLGRTEGILVGISSGAALHAAIQLASRPDNAGKTIVVLLPDTGERYLSTPLYATL